MRGKETDTERALVITTLLLLLLLFSNWPPLSFSLFCYHSAHLNILNNPECVQLQHLIGIHNAINCAGDMLSFLISLINGRFCLS